jgi:hemerythrin-like domain-containing protein
MASVDLFTGIHKAVRNMLFTAGVKMQSLDAENAEERASLIEDIDTILELFREHASNEDTLIFLIVMAEAPGLAAALDAEHRSHAAVVAALMDARDQFAAAPDPAGRAVTLAKLRHVFFGFVAEHLLHMNHEEREMLPATQRWVTDEQLTEVLRRIIGGMPPERHAQWMRWMIPALAPQELAGMLRGLAAAPPQMLQTVERIAAAVLPPVRWTQVRALVDAQETLAA